MPEDAAATANAAAGPPSTAAAGTTTTTTTAAAGATAGPSVSVPGARGTTAGGGQAPITPGAVTTEKAVDQAAYMGQRVYENTYRLKPDVKFQSQRTTKVVNDILESKLKSVVYSPEKANEVAKSVSDEILRAVKKLEFDRYKFVVEVVISEFKGQGFRVASRSLWNASTDSYASVSFHNATLTAVAMVFGCYVE